MISQFDTLKVDRHGFVAKVTLDRPPVNALNAQMRAEIIALFDMISDLADVRAVVLTGAGGMFCAGADLKERPKTGPGHEGSYWSHNRSARECSNAIRECSKPVICALNGPAIGAGFGLMAAADIWLASNKAFVAMTEVNVGLAGGTALLQEVFGKSRARRMYFTGCRVAADELYRLGLVEACLPEERLMPYAMTIANEIAEKSPLAIRYAKQAMQITSLLPLRDGYRYEQNLTAALAKSEEAEEARKAFFEKRKPDFKNS